MQGKSKQGVGRRAVMGSGPAGGTRVVCGPDTRGPREIGPTAAALSVGVLAEVAAARVHELSVEQQLPVYRALSETLADEGACRTARAVVRTLSRLAALQLQFQNLRRGVDSQRGTRNAERGVGNVERGGREVFLRGSRFTIPVREGGRP